MRFLRLYPQLVIQRQGLEALSLGFAVPPWPSLAAQELRSLLHAHGVF
jgi:hypothetical protein